MHADAAQVALSHRKAFPACVCNLPGICGAILSVLHTPQWSEPWSKPPEHNDTGVVGTPQTCFYENGAYADSREATPHNFEVPPQLQSSARAAQVAKMQTAISINMRLLGLRFHASTPLGPHRTRSTIGSTTSGPQRSSPPAALHALKAQPGDAPPLPPAHRPPHHTRRRSPAHARQRRRTPPAASPHIGRQVVHPSGGAPPALISPP